MIDKDLELIRAEGQLAVGDPEAYVLSNPTPRDWTLTAQEIAQSVKLDPRKMAMLRKTDFEPETLNIAETLGQGTWDALTDGSMLSSIQTSLASWSSPDMTQEEADRLMQDVLYTRSYTRKAKDILNAQKITHDDWYDFSNGVGSFIKYALLGGITGSPAAIGMFAGAEAGSQLEADLVDRYIEKHGDIKGYTSRERNIDLGLSGAYGVFNGAVESMLGVERVATGAVRSRINKELTSRLIGASRSTGKSAREIMMRLEDLQVQMGRKFSQKAWQNARRIATSAGEEGLEEAIQSLGEDLTTAIAGYSDDFTASGVLGKAATNAMYGAIIGGPAGWGLYRYNRKTFIDRLNKWNKDRNVGLKDNEVVEFADKILDEGKSRMFDEIATRAEIKFHYGQAYDLVKKRISDVIDATGTTPWKDKTKTKEEYVQVLADSITWPSISVANQLNIPLSEFLEIADIESWVVGNTVGFKPITSIQDIDEIIRQQKLIIKEQRANKKLGVDNEDALNTAKQRLAIAERVRLELIQEQNIIQERTTRRKEKADYTTAKGLQPDQVKTLDNATQATADQDFVLFAGKRIPVEYQVVELDSVQPSHINGTPNPNYTNKALQNRASRGTTQDVADLRGKASPENFTPERLMKATTSAEGSPVVNAKNEVIAGNGRTEIVRYAYENPQTAEQYKQELQKQGFNIDGMNKPMLVRKNTTLNDPEQVAAADISNISETSAFDEASQARRDTQYLKDSPTAIDFAAKLPMSEKRGLMLNNGKWNKRKVQQRYEDALLAWLCGNDTTLFENLVLDRKLSQKVIDTLTANGALLYETATKYPELELREDIYHALVKMQNATRDNFIELTQQLELDGHDVMPENIMVWNWLFTDASTNRQFMNSYATILANNHESVEAGQDMFGQKVAPLSKKDALIQALKKADQAKAETAMARGREYEPLFNEENVATDVNLAAAIISYNNQFAPTNNLNQAQLQQFDLADENARLDDIYPEYTGETIEVDGKERTVYNSNGERIAKSAEALRNFYKWFGDSKVVDSQGRPLVVYHGSPNVFDAFDTRRPKDKKTWLDKYGQQLNFGSHFATDKKDVKFYGYGKNIYSVYLKIENPYFIEDGMQSVQKTREEGNKVMDDLIAQGYDGVAYYPAHHWTDATGEYPIHHIDKDSLSYVAFEPTQIKSVDNRGTYSDKTGNIYYQKRGLVRGFYDPELLTITLTKYWNETTFVHEQHHRFLDKLFGYYKQIQTGERVVPDAFIQSMDQLFQMLDIDPAQDQLTVVQQEKFATMVEAYLTGLGVDNPDNLAFKSFLHWIPEQYKSILDLGYLDENGEIQNPILDQQSIDWFNKWFANPFTPSLATSPEAQKLVNPTDENGEIVPSKQKVMNDREKDWGQDSEQQQKADAQLWRAMGENTPTNIRAALDGEKERMKAEANNQPDDTKLPEEHKPTLREKWFRPRQKDAREIAATKAREYLAQNPEHARQLAFADPETMTEFDAPVDQGMLIRAVMETVPHGSDEWYILNDNLAVVKSMSGSTLSLSGDLTHQAYLDAKREVEAARELKAAINYAGTRRGAIDKWNGDIRAFIAKNVSTVLATEPNSPERKTAIKAFLEEAKTKFSANTTNAILNQMDLTGLQTKNSQVFVKWAEKQIKQAAHAKIDTAEQKELMKASIAAQLALKEIDNIEQRDGLFVRATQAAKDIRHWQFVKDKIKKAYIGRWGKFGIFWDNLFGSYAPSAMLMSVNTLFFANVPSTALNSRTIKWATKIIGKNNVDKSITDAEEERIRQVFNASGVNLAQMDKPTSPSTLHGEKYMNMDQKHWYNFTFEILGRTDNVFRIPRFVDALARIATKNAGGDKAKANILFKEYAKLNNQSDEAKIARKQALAVANMAVFTQDGMMASALNHIRSALNTLTRTPFGLDPNGFGLGNILAPFLKTGANITEMGLSATFAPIKSIAFGFQKLQGKEIPDIKKMTLVSDWINLAYTSVAVAVLASISGDDDDWYEEPYQSGRKYDPNKPYDSIRIGNTWVKLDIFGPMAIPLRTAAMLVKDWETDKLQAISDGMFEALSETPLVQSFTDSNLDYMTRQPEKYWSSFAYNQANKLVPAQAKSVTRAVSRGTGATWNTDWLGQTINRKFHRNYGLDSTRLTTNDLINVLTNRIKVGND